MLSSIALLALLAGGLGLSALVSPDDTDDQPDDTSDPQLDTATAEQNGGGADLLDEWADWTIDAPDEELLGIIEISSEDGPDQGESTFFVITNAAAEGAEDNLVLRPLDLPEGETDLPDDAFLNFNGQSIALSDLPTETLADPPEDWSDTALLDTDADKDSAEFDLSLTEELEGLTEALGNTPPEGSLVQPDPDAPLSEVIQGTDGDDLIEHAAHTGTGSGTAGEDLAVAGGQTIVAGEGDDIIRMGEQDQAWGGEGADQFEVYAMDGTHGPSIIQDFDPTEDQILTFVNPDLIGTPAQGIDLESQISIEIEQPDFGPPETVVSWGGTELLRLPGDHSGVTPTLHDLSVDGPLPADYAPTSPLVMVYGRA